MGQNDWERRNYFQMQAEFRGLVHQQFAELRGSTEKLEDKVNGLNEQFAGWKVRVSLLGAVVCTILAAMAVLYMLLKG